MSATHPPEEWTVQELKARLDRGEPLKLLDVRRPEEVRRWRIETKAPVTYLHIPYAELAPEGDSDDPMQVARHIERRGMGDLPKEGPLAVICARGVTSALVARALTALGLPAAHVRGGMEAWGRLYEVKPVVQGAELSIYQVARPARGCLSYVIASQGRAMVVDPLRHTEEYLRLAEQKGLRVERVLDTHAHADHLSGGPALARRLGVLYHLHPYDGIHPIDGLPATIPFDYLRDGQELRVGSVAIRVLHIPGHTLGNVAFLVDERYLLTGDSLFLDSIARPDLGGRGEAWAPLHHRSLRKLLELPETTVVLPGHYAHPREADAQGLFAAPLGALKAKNEGVRKVQEGERAFVEYILKSLPEFPPEYVEIKRANLGLLKPDEPKAQELELGRNLCALAQAYPTEAEPGEAR